MNTFALPRHRATTANLATLSPWMTPPPHDRHGVRLGRDVLAGGAPFRWDPFDAYTAGEVTNPNVLVAGEPGSGKSTAVKCYPARAARRPGGRARWIAIADPKGEYTDLARRLRLTTVVLRPGGQARLNPLADLDRHPERAVELLAAFAQSVLARPLVPIETATLVWTVEWLAGRRWRAEPSLADAIRVLAAPPADLAAEANQPADVLAARVEDVRLGLQRLMSGPLRGMFDGPSTVRLDPAGHGVVVDLSGVHHDPLALRLVLVAVTGWLQSVTAAGGRRSVQVIDEAWSLLSDPHATRWLQTCWKLGRSHGTANIAVVHRCSDLRSQADDGTAQAKVAAGLLADTQTRVLFRQSPGESGDARALLGLTDPEATLVTHLVRGHALWRLGDRSYVVQHQLHRTESRMVDTDQAIR